MVDPDTTGLGPLTAEDERVAAWLRARAGRGQTLVIDTRQMAADLRMTGVGCGFAALMLAERGWFSWRPADGQAREEQHDSA